MKQASVHFTKSASLHIGGKVSERLHVNRCIDDRAAQTMKTPVSTQISRYYVSASMFLGAYAPLALLFAMRLMGKNHPIKAAVCVLIFVLVAANLFLMLRVMRAEPGDYRAAEVESGSGELAAFAASYLLPFVVVGDVSNWDLAAYAAYMIVVAIISLRGDYLHLNPLLAICGYRLYTITTGRGRRWLVLSMERIRKDDELDARALSPGVLLVTSNRSARERETKRISSNP
jgi:hypothetical protein